MVMEKKEIEEKKDEDYELCGSVALSLRWHLDQRDQNID